AFTRRRLFLAGRVTLYALWFSTHGYERSFIQDLGVWGFGGKAPIMIAPVGRVRAPIYPPNSPRPYKPALRGVGG
ncbi:MAG: hypothetical protein KBD67_05295, partial [Anaerolineaceae bacterium]|nr:hypothetical protein [Anaerolineaceae bacterium]